MQDTNLRQEARQPVLKTAKVKFGNAVVDCLVVNQSKNGIRISTETYTPFPEDVVVELRSGGLWAAKLRWQRGLETGFEFTRFDGLNNEAVDAAETMWKRLINSNARVVTRDLATANWFDDAGIKAASLAADAAIARLERELQAASGGTFKRVPE